MLRSFLHYFEQENINRSTCKVLCSVSGGKDSMVMLHLFIQAKIPVTVAHINHKTRGEENELDFTLISEYCKGFDVPVHYYELDPSIANSSNFQAIASNKRYTWMNQLLKDYNYTHIATAHHKDDNVESFIINLLRGAGLKGLSGIAPIKNETIIRPLYYVTRKEIDQYQLKHNIPFREDSSNLKDDYLRNKIRHNILEPLKKLEDTAVEQINESIRLIAEGEQLLQYYINNDQDLIISSSSGFIVQLDGVMAKPSPHTILWYLLSNYNFNKYDIHDMLKSERSGAVFYSKTHKAKLNRNQLYIQAIDNNDEDLIDIAINDIGVYQIKKHLKIKFELVETLELTKEAHIEYLGFTSTPFPLKIRTRMSGDYFKPIGLKGKTKKVKDFITDIKLNVNQKNDTIILEKNGEIVSVLPYRISEDYKVGRDSKYILKVSYLRNNL